MTPNQHEVTVRVREIFEELKQRGKVRFNRDYLGFTGMSEGNISSILNHSAARPANFPKKYYGPLLAFWNIRKEYLLEGKGQMFEDEQEEETVKSILIEIREQLKEITKLLKQ